VLALEGETGGVYNVGSGLERTSGDIFKLLCEVSGQTREFTESKPGFVQNPVASLAHITSNTTWRPQIPFEQTLRDTLAFWRLRQTG